MAGPAAVAVEAWDKVTGFLHSQIHDKEKWENNYVSALLILRPICDPFYPSSPYSSAVSPIRGRKSEKSMLWVNKSAVIIKLPVCLVVFSVIRLWTRSAGSNYRHPLFSSPCFVVYLPWCNCVMERLSGIKLTQCVLCNLVNCSPLLLPLVRMLSL
jgi:hypothetical protein